MHFLPNERTALFIDGANLYSASRNLGFDVDYRNLLEFFRRKTHVMRAYYYSAVLETEEYSPLKPLTDWLAYNGYTLVTKPAKEFTDSTGRRRVKGNMDIEVAMDMLELADKLDHAVLFSGDSDFRRLVEAVQRRGVRVSVVSSIRTSPPMIADELRRQADQFLELAEIAPEFTRRQMEPRAPRTTVPPPRQTPAEPFADSSTTRPEPPCCAWRRRRSSSRARDCPLCPRLAAYRAANRAAHPTGSTRRCRASGRPRRACWSSAWRPGCAAPTAPGGRSPAITPGVLLYATLLRFGLAAGDYRADREDGLALHDCRIVNAVRCVPPANLPEPAEVTTCNRFLRSELHGMAELRAVLALGVLAHAAVLRACGMPPARDPLPPRRDPRAARRAAAGRQLSCLALQHRTPAG